MHKMEDKSAQLEQIDRILAEFVQNEVVAGLTVGVVYNGQQTFSRQYGVKNTLTGEPVQSSTLFHLASVSKTAVSTAIMQLAENGSLELDSPVVKYLPYFTIADERCHLITIKHLLNHTSGLPDEEVFEWDKPQYDEQSLERYVRDQHGLVLLTEPGEQFAYSNIGYEILGDVIAKVSGMSFENYMKTHILEPAGMHSSSYLKQEIDTHLASPHILTSRNGYGATVSEIFPYNRRHAPSSTLYSNAEDMCKYALIHLNKGTSKDNNTLLTPNSYNSMWHSDVSTGWGKETSAIGLGWFIGEYNGHRIVSHAGMDTGFTSLLTLLPDHGIAISIMLNCDFIWFSRLNYLIIDALLGKPVTPITRSLVHHLTAIAISNGVEAAMDAYSEMKEKQMDIYYIRESEVPFIYDTLVEYGCSDDADTALLLGSRLFPESENIREYLGKIKAAQV